MIPYEYREIKLPPVNRREVLRYAGAENDAGIPVDECLAEMTVQAGGVVFAEADISVCGERINLGFAEATSHYLAKALGASGKIMFFAATIGFLPDRLISKYSRLSPAKAVLLQAAAAERIEALCDTFCNERKLFYAAKGLTLKQRFSPGYGDLSLELQRDIINVLDCKRLLGISLTDSLLMMPSKSVTAIAGICG